MIPSLTNILLVVIGAYPGALRRCDRRRVLERHLLVHAARLPPATDRLHAVRAARVRWLPGGGSGRCSTSRSNPTRRRARRRRRRLRGRIRPGHLRPRAATARQRSGHRSRRPSRQCHRARRPDRLGQVDDRPVGCRADRTDRRRGTTAARSANDRVPRGVPAQRDRSRQHRTRHPITPTTSCGMRSTRQRPPSSWAGSLTSSTRWSASAG